jgi:hypothetical protein
VRPCAGCAIIAAYCFAADYNWLQLALYRAVRELAINIATGR